LVVPFLRVLKQSILYLLITSGMLWGMLWVIVKKRFPL